MARNPSFQNLADELPPLHRLAAAYAPARARAAWLGLLVLDQRLGRAATGAREPILAQLRLAWWRDRFRTPAAEWLGGEPVLAALAGWDDERGALEALVDGWEGVAAGDGGEAAAAALGEARAAAMVALARVVGCDDRDGAIAAAAGCWAFVQPPPTRRARLPRAMRPLAVLAELAQAPELGGALALARIIRLGLLGR